MSHALDLETGVFCVNTCEPLRLDAYNVSVELETCAAKVFLKQEYKNVSLKPKKVFYQFLVPTNWSLLHIETHVEETVDTGTIHGTCSDFLHQRIADRAEPLLRVPIAQNVPIGQTVMIALTFVVPVWCRNGGLCDEVTLIIPSSTMPSSSCQILKSAARSEWKDSFSFSCPTRLTAGYQLVVSGKLLRRIKKVDVQGLTTVKNTSKNDSCIDVRAEDRATDLTSKEVKILFQLQAELQDPHNALQAVVCKNSTACESNAEETNVLLCAITPSFRDDMDKKLWQTPNVEYILCLDNHLSMMDKRSDVIRGIQIWLRSLPDACLLNVAIFGPELCFFQPGGSRLVNRNLINECSERYLWSTFTCNNTKRELYNSLLEVYMKPATEGYARQILFVTDGSERNSSARCVQLVASNSDTTRFHAITIGERADRSSFEKMAHATNGQYAHCARSTQFRAVLMKRTRETFHRPCLTNVQITLTSSSEPRIETMIRPCQDVIPLCFGQEQVTALFFSRVIPDDLEVAVVGYIEKRRVTYRIRIDDAKTTTTYGAPNPFLHTFTALNRIQFLTQLQTKSSCSEDEMCEVDRLVSMYHVLSPHHYFEIKGSRLHYMDRPVLPIRPWEPLPQTTLLTPIPDPPCDEPRSTECTSTYLPNRALCRQLLLEHVLRYVCDDPILDDLLFSQQSDGKWLPGCALARHMRVPHSKLLESLEEHRANRNAWVTLMVLLVIQKDFPDQEDEYIAIVEREMKLLTNELGSPEALAALHSQVEAFLSVNRGSE